MRSKTLLASALLFAASSACQCGSSKTAGSFEVQLAPSGLRVSSADAAHTVLLESHQSEAPYVPLAVRRNGATWEEVGGAFKVADGTAPWQTSAGSKEDLSIAGGESADWLDSAGATVATLKVEAPAEGALKLTFTAADSKMNRLSLAFTCAAGDHFVGFGAQTDALDHRGHKIPIWTSEQGIGKSDSDDPSAAWPLEGARHSSYLGLPTWLSQRGYIGVVKTNRRAVFELCSAKQDAWRVEVWGPELELWLFYGPEPAKALERATAAVLGRPMRPPPLAFAPWNDALFGSANVRRIAKLLRERQIPSSVIWTEDFRGGEKVGVSYRLIEDWDTDRTLYPDAEQVAADLHAQGFAWLAYFNSFLVSGSKVFAEADAGGHFVGSKNGGKDIFMGPTFKDTGLADLFRPETREWVKGHLRKALDVGFDGWMTDFGEWLPHDAVLADGSDPMEAHNLYSAEWSKLSEEVLAERANDGKQRLFFARSGWIGSTAYVPVYWAGDQRTDFQPDDGMPTVIPIGLGMGLAGISTFGHDIGGYQSATNPPATKELFFRWTSLGALSPVMRTHHGTDPDHQWWFGADEETIAHFQRWAKLHMQLFPYLDGGSAVAEATGLPLMRALPLAFPEDEAGWTLFDEYLLGPALLAAPIQAEGKLSRRVHLPPALWLPLNGGAALQGPADLDVDAPLTELPTFARAGSIIPLLPEGVQTVLPADASVPGMAAADGKRELLVFLGADGSFAERDGTTYRLSSGGAATGFSETGQALPNCGSAEQRGCVDSASTAFAATRLRLSGRGPVDLGGYTLNIEGGPARQFDVLVRR